jgi:hypothetical protein
VAVVEAILLVVKQGALLYLADLAVVKHITAVAHQEHQVKEIMEVRLVVLGALEVVVQEL